MDGQSKVWTEDMCINNDINCRVFRFVNTMYVFRYDAYTYDRDIGTCTIGRATYQALVKETVTGGVSAGGLYVTEGGNLF